LAKKKIAELELSLLHLQQNVEIPNVILTIHPIIQDCVNKEIASGNRPSLNSLGDLAHDSSFLNKIQSDVNNWIKEIQKVTHLSRDPSSGTASQEINFWLSLERNLHNIEDQLKSDEIILTLETLKSAKRFHATVSFLADTGLKEALELVARYNQLMKDFPLDELLSATDAKKIRESIILIFGHLNKKLRISPYPFKLSLPFFEAISRDLNDQLHKFLESKRLMHMEFAEFSNIIEDCESVFQTWEENIKDFTNVAREVTRKRSEKFIPIKIYPAHQKLRERLNFLKSFRQQHDQLRTTVSFVAKSEKGSGIDDLTGSDINDEIRLAYECIRDIDVLDISPGKKDLYYYYFDYYCCCCCCCYLYFFFPEKRENYSRQFLMHSWEKLECTINITHISLLFSSRIPKRWSASMDCSRDGLS